MMHLVKLESRQTSSNRDISICFDSNTCICAILPLMFSLFCFCILETPSLRDSRVVVPNEEKRERSRSRPGSGGPELVCRRTQITPLLWGITMDSTRKIHSIYPLSLTASPHDISLRDSLSSTSPLGAAVFCLYSACRRFESPVELLFKTNGSLSTGMWPGRWNCVDWSIMTSHTSLSLRSEIGDSIRWHMIRGGGKTNTIPQRPQPACLLWAVAVSATRLNNSGLTSQLAWQGDYCVSYWNYQV